MCRYTRVTAIAVPHAIPLNLPFAPGATAGVIFWQYDQCDHNNDRQSRSHAIGQVLSQQLGISRALVARELRAKRVTVDGEVVKSGAIKLTPEQVAFDGNPLQQQNGPRYFMLNKPQGYVCSTDDPDHPTVLYFLDEPVAYKLHAAGRLDIDTTGLVLMTDDGQWSHRVTSPRHHCEKTYLVTLEHPLAEDTAQRFAEGAAAQRERPDAPGDAGAG